MCNLNIQYYNYGKRRDRIYYLVTVLLCLFNSFRDIQCLYICVFLISLLDNMSDLHNCIDLQNDSIIQYVEKTMQIEITFDACNDYAHYT